MSKKEKPELNSLMPCGKEHICPDYEYEGIHCIHWINKSCELDEKPDCDNCDTAYTKVDDHYECDVKCKEKPEPICKFCSRKLILYNDEWICGHGCTKPALNPSEQVPDNFCVVKDYFEKDYPKYKVVEKEELEWLFSRIRVYSELEIMKKKDFEKKYMEEK